MTKILDVKTWKSILLSMQCVKISLAQGKEYRIRCIKEKV